MLRVQLTHPPSIHTYYAEMVAAHPPDVSYLWDDKPVLPSAPASTLKNIAVLLLRALRLPNLRLLHGKSLNHVDVIHSCQNLLLARRPWVVDIEHGAPFVGVYFNRLQHRMTRKIVHSILASRFCQAILPWTHTAAKGFLQTLQPEEAVANRIRIVHPAVQVTEPVSHREESASCPLLFVVNRPEWNFFLKGGRELLEAYRLLREKRRHLSLVVVGPVPTDIVATYAAVPGIAFVGRMSRAELYELYRKAAIYVMPSFSDTFGMVFLEAMAFSLPIVALDKPYTQEVVRQGETGLLVPLHEASNRWFNADGRPRMNSDTFIKRMVDSETDHGVVKGLVETIGCLVDDPHLRTRLGANGYEEVAIGRFSVTRRNQLLGQVYREAAILGREKS